MKSSHLRRRHAFAPYDLLPYLFHHSAGPEPCPICGAPYDECIPLLGANGVDEAYGHQMEDEVWKWHYSREVLDCPDPHDVASDGLCLYQNTHPELT